MKVADDWGNNQIAIYCEGCKSHHAFTLGQNGWWFNFDFVNPTFDPSMLVNGSIPDEFKGKEGYLRCHSFVRNGNIEYLGDCDHEFKNTTRKLLPLDEHPSKILLNNESHHCHINSSYLLLFV